MLILVLKGALFLGGAGLGAGDRSVVWLVAHLLLIYTHTSVPITGVRGVSRQSMDGQGVRHSNTRPRDTFCMLTEMHVPIK